MTTIQGTLKDSGNQTINGRLRITLDGPLTNNAVVPNDLLVPEVYEYAIANGVINVTLKESATQNTTYRFEVLALSIEVNFFFLNGEPYLGPAHQHTDNKWYTGETHTSESVELLRQENEVERTLSDFHAIVPNVNTVEFAELVPTGITTDVLDTAIRRIAELLTSVVDYVEALRGGPRWKGGYDAATYYQKDDAVSYGGSSWMYINPDPAAGQTPSLINTDYWVQIAEKGDPGGTGGDDTPYDPVGWDSDPSAPSKNAVRDIIEALARKTEVNAKAPIASPNFTGAPTAPTQAAGTSNTTLATTAFVDSNYIPKSNPTLSGIVLAPTVATTDFSQRVATTEFVKNFALYSYFSAYAATAQVIPDGSIPTTVIFGGVLSNQNSNYNAATGVYTAPVTGLYEFRVVIGFTGRATTVLIAELYVSGSSFFRLFDVRDAGPTVMTGGRAMIFLGAGATVDIRARVTYAAGSSDLTVRQATSPPYLSYFLGRRIG
jgi:hypothetical protein